MNSNIKVPINEDEPYWFLRWIAMRRERNLLKKEVEELRNLEISKLYRENNNLKETLIKIREEYQPIKIKIHNGHNKKRIRK